MSINLYFVARSGRKRVVDFPFQTPTTLSYAMMTTKTTEARLALVDDEMKKWGWTTSERESCLKRVRVLLEDPDLQLTII